MIQPDRLLPLLKTIQDQGVDFEVVIIGGVAAIAHGVYRATLDLDLLIDSGDLDLVNLKTVLDAILRQNGGILPGLEDLGPLTLSWQAAARPGSSDPLKNAVVAVIDSRGNRVLDFLGAYWKYDREAIENRIALEGFEPLSVIDAPHLILMKLQANGPQDRLDIYEVFRLADQSTQLRILGVVEEYGKKKALKTILDNLGLDVSDLERRRAEPT